MKTIAHYLFLIPFICLSSCSTYNIPVDSFKSQFANIDYASLHSVRIQYPSGIAYDCYVNPIDTIYCIDKNNTPKSLKKSPSIETKITHGNNKKTIFYFDTLYLQDSVLVGDQSRYAGMEKRIPINDVSAVEIQDGKKRFKYIKQK